MGGLGKPEIKDILERAADIYKNISSDDSKGAEKAALYVKRVDYMSVYASNLVAAVRKAAGNIGTFTMFCINENMIVFRKRMQIIKLICDGTPMKLGTSSVVINL